MLQPPESGCVGRGGLWMVRAIALLLLHLGTQRRINTVVIATFVRTLRVHVVKSSRQYNHPFFVSGATVLPYTENR